MSKSSGTISAEETKQLENNENRVSQGVEQISGGEIQELNVLSPEHGTNMEEEISELYKVRDISTNKLSQLANEVCCLLMVLNSESEKRMACAEYGQQQNRKLELDAKLKEWRKSKEAEHLDEIESKKSHKSSKSGSSCGSSASTKLSRQSKRKEKMALAQLKLQELKVLQEYEREEQELKRKRDLYVAEMEAKQATVSYQIVMEQDSNSCDLNVPMEANLHGLLRKE
ncbi:Hypothetical predicted protein [Paramuricea clavata]|uniref:Uncharacterized protein n=1 Tax=Paramuricea clavata TaxID=317549 RepID=A0A6S7HQI8_PARCT|nr:Hypothetical predicted protein [Paramuricea clavata]